MTLTRLINARLIDTRHLRRSLGVGVGALAIALALGTNASAAPTDTPAATGTQEQQIATVEDTYSAVTPLPGATTVAPAASSSPATTSSTDSADSVAAAKAAVHCWTLDVTRKGKNIFGGTLISLKTHTSWCGDGKWVRSRASTTSSHTNSFGWAYEGFVKNYDQYGVNWNQYHAVRQAQFCLLNCVAQSKYLTNDISVGPAGQVYHR